MNRKALFHFVISLTTVYSSHGSQKDIEENAIVKGYGYKAANLTFLQTTTNQMGSSAYELKIPPFVAVSSSTIKEAYKKYNLDIDQRWKAIINTFCSTKDTQDEILKKNIFPDGFITQAQELAHDLRTSGLNFIPNTEAVGLLEKALDQKINVVVRSTGKEDSAFLANAGGNVSIVNVTPEINKVSEAIKKVISSYFSKQSLMQRLEAGDQGIFDASQLTPVIIQNMIDVTPDESNNTALKCGVMFTEEPNGGIAKYAPQSDNDNPLPTTGITLINAAYGNNEGVVNSLIPVDTYYLTNDYKIFPVIRYKTERVQSGKDSLVKNNFEQASRPALSRDALTTLKKYAHRLESIFYKRPMDVEFVIDEAKKIIYIVQARPIVYNKTHTTPTYCNTIENISDKHFTGAPIVVSSGSVIICTNIKQVIITKTIKEALNIYQDLKTSAEKEDIACIIISQMAPATSHEATTFRSTQKPVICIPEINAASINQWLQENNSVLISPQQGIIAKLNKSYTIPELLDNLHIQKGWSTYPIPKRLSLVPSFSSKKVYSKETLKTLLPPIIKNWSTFIEEYTEKRKKVSWQDYIALLKTGPADNAQIALVMCLHEIFEQLEDSQLNQNQVIDTDLSFKIELLKTYLYDVAQAILETLTIQPSDNAYPKRLFAVQQLETLLYQQPNFAEIIYGYSAANIIAQEIIPELNIKKANALLSDMAVQLMKVADYAFTDETKKSWKKLIENLSAEKEEASLQQLAQIVKKFSLTNSLGAWLNTIFTTTWNETTKNDDAPEVAQKIISASSINERAQNFINTINESLTALTSDYFSSSNQEIFNAHLSFLQNTIVNPLTNQTFIDLYKNSNDTEKMMLVSLMSKTIDAVDNSIKSLTRSTQYQEKLSLKAQNFQKLLKLYFSLFTSSQAMVKNPNSLFFPGQDFKIYNTIIRRTVNKTINENPIEEFNTKSTFNTQLLVLGNGLPIGPMLPRMPELAPNSLEEIFTVIHQNLLIICSILISQNQTLQNIILPEPIKNINNFVKNFKFIDTNKAIQEIISLTGIQITDQSTILIYNITIRQHSVQIILEQKRNKNTATVSLKFYGANESNRWNKLEKMAYIIAPTFNAELITANVMNMNCTLILQITTETKNQELMHFIANSIGYVTGDNFNTKPEYLLPYKDIIEQSINSIQDQTIKDELIHELNEASKSLAPTTDQLKDENQPTYEPEGQSNQTTEQQENPAEPQQTQQKSLWEKITAPFSNIIDSFRKVAKNIGQAVTNTVTTLSQFIRSFFSSNASQ